MNPSKQTDNVELKRFIETKSPELLYNNLRSLVIGQDEACKALSIVAFKHLINVCRKSSSSVTVKKPNSLLIGPSGSGKTFLLQNLTKLLNLPLVIIDASQITIGGYHGSSINDIGEQLLVQAGNDIHKASMGVVFLDEIDKTVYSGLEVKNIQSELLKVVEGSTLPSTKGDIDTTNILFISGGVFKGVLDKEDTTEVGFSSVKVAKALIDPNYNLIKNLTSFGLSYEFLGRFPTIITLNRLDDDALKLILDHKIVGPFSDFIDVLSIIGKTLVIEKGVGDFIIQEAGKLDTGARALHYVVSKILDKLYFSELTKTKKVLTLTLKDIKCILGL